MPRFDYTLAPPPRLGKGAILAVIAAIAGLLASCSGHPWWGLLLATAAVPLGLIGMLRSAAPEIRGGIVSLAAFLLGLLGILLALVGIVFKIILWPFR